MELTREQAVAILEYHGIRHRDAAEWLEIEATWTVRGVVKWAWEECPRTVVGLYSWLGY
jgi:hypothetical protein